jgi:hypothetical protein
MTQPAGRVRDLSAKHRFILQSSPFICALNAISTHATWLWHMFWNLEAPLTAARRIARARFRDVEEVAEEDSIESLEKNRPFRYTVYLLGAVPQFVKLFGSSSIPWIQTWGAMYVGSWIVLQVAFHAENDSYEVQKLPGASQGPSQVEAASRSVAGIRDRSSRVSSPILCALVARAWPNIQDGCHFARGSPSSDDVVLIRLLEFNGPRSTFTINCRYIY